MKKNKIFLLIPLLAAGLLACNHQATTQEKPAVKTDSVTVKKDAIAPRKDTPSINVSNSAVGVHSSKADVNVNDKGASVKTGKVKVKVQNDTAK